MVWDDEQFKFLSPSYAEVNLELEYLFEEQDPISKGGTGSSTLGERNEKRGSGQTNS